MPAAISFSVLNVLSEDALRTVQHELIVFTEGLRADGVSPTRGQADCIRLINEELAKREARNTPRRR